MDFLSHLLATAGLLLLVFYLWKVRIHSHKIDGMLSPPQPSGALPIIGHLHKLGGRNPLSKTLAAMADKYGPMFTIRLGRHPALVISNYDAVKECFTKKDRVFATRPESRQGLYLYNYAAFGFSPYNTYWRDMRKMAIVELLSSRRLETLKHVQISEVDAFIKGLYSICKTKGTNGQVKVVISEWIENLTFNAITKMIAGKRYFDSASSTKSDEGEDHEKRSFGKIVKEFMYVSGRPVVSDVIGFPNWMNFNGKIKAMKRIAKELDSIVGSWVKDHYTKESNSSKENDFIDVMLSVIEDNSKLGYSRETIIKATATNLILAGSETTAVNLTWILSLLLNNKHVLKRAQEELDLIVGRDRWVEDTDIKNLIYLQAIVKETLRLYPPAPLSVPHEAMEDCQVCGFHVPKGTRLFVNMWKLHRDPNIWSDPEVFFPERFLASQAGIDASGQHFEFIPFGSGRRSCPGVTLALQVTHLTIGRLLQAFELKTPLDMPVDLTEGLGITLPKATSLEVILTPRLPSTFYEG